MSAMVLAVSVNLPPRWCRITIVFLVVFVPVHLSLLHAYSNEVWLTSHAAASMMSNVPTSELQHVQMVLRVPKKSTTIAYAISVTSCQLNQTGTVLDGPAVLSHSIHQVHADSVYEYQLYAFVHPNALPCATPLRQLGFKTLMRNVPIDVRNIQSASYRRAVETRGCCGSLEFLKLWAYTLVDHDIVVHVDTDVFFHKSIDPIFNRMLQLPVVDGTTTPPTGSTTSPINSLALLHTHHHTDNNVTLPLQIDFLFTRDYHQQSTITTDPTRYGVQGGFFVARPSLAVFDEMKSILLQGQYREHDGWGRAYHGGYWGASQVQGFLSYYYTTVHPEQAVELNHCLYNAMLDDPMDRSGKCRTRTETCQDCRQVALADMFSIHLTVCWKPWQVSVCSLMTMQYRFLQRQTHLLTLLIDSFRIVPTNIVPFSGP